MQSSTPSAPVRLQLAGTILSALALGLAAALVHSTGLGAFRALATLAAWGTGLGLSRVLPAWPWRLRPSLLVLLALIGTYWLWWPRAGRIAGATDQTLQLAAIACGSLAFVLQFALTYARKRAPEADSTGSAFLQLLAVAHLLVALAVLALLYFRLNWLTALEQILLGLVAALLLEFVLQAVFRFYQPKRLRHAGTPVGESVLLPILCGQTRPLHQLLAAFERNFGLRLSDAWLLRQVRLAAAPLLLLGGTGLWLSTGVTRVPVDASGVLSLRGEFLSPALPAGLHFHAPWPWGRVHLVRTGRVEEISLGFERDLAGPVLWNEPHFEGEQNLLVGSGEELLTVNVPVQYRIRDAVASLRRTADPRAALGTLGSRALLGLATGHNAFALMTTDRAAASAQLHQALQAACDRLGLGVEIIHVGLKDVHPPVAIAGAFQDVVSAEEEQVTLVDQARSYAVQAGGAAQVAAHLTRVEADTAAATRLALAAGEIARFLAPLDTWHAHPAVLAERLRLETLEATLAAVPRLYVVPEKTAGRTLSLGTLPTAPTR